MLRFRIMVETYEASGAPKDAYALHGHAKAMEYFGKDGKPNAMLSSILRRGFIEVEKGGAIVITREWVK